MDDSFFALNSYHLLLGALGSALVLGYWFPAALLRRPAGSAALIVAMGMLVPWGVPEVAEALNPLDAPGIWEKVSELVVVIVLFSTGLKIDDWGKWRIWHPAALLLIIAMPLTILSLALLGWTFAAMTFAGALTLGAVLAPTDPVLAGDVQVGPPERGRESAVRFTLTTEAGLNDGLAFPFVYLGISLAAASQWQADLFQGWLLVDVLYRIVTGAIGGVVLGGGLGYLAFVKGRAARLADSSPGVLALAITFLCYGAVELVEGYGFIAVFVSGLFFRQMEKRHRLHQRLHDFGESIEQALTALLLFALGSVLPLLWQYLTWTHAAMGIALICIIRPAVGWLSLLGTNLSSRERWAVSFLGVRGIGSLYYLSYAAGKIEFTNIEQIWAMTGFTIFASTLFHGVTAGPIMEHLERASESDPDPPASG